MGSRKEHHYVPAFYLRHFATNEAQNTIGLFNTSNQKFLYNANIGKQVREKFLYGEDDSVEAAFADIEFSASKILRKIIAELKIPEIHTDDYITLIYFLLLQHSRTKKRKDSVNESMEELHAVLAARLKALGDEDAALSVQREACKPTSMLEILMMANGSLNFLKYLDCHILINETKMPFITSDHPVILYNIFMEMKESPLNGNSWPEKGLVVFYPVTPQLTLFWTDTFVYKCASIKKKTVVRTQVVEDIVQLNGLQYIYCSSQVFFNEKFTLAAMKQLVNKFSENRKAPVRIKEFGSYVMNFEKYQKVKLKLSFLELNKKAKEFTLTGSVIHFRHPSFRTELEKIRRQRRE